MSLLRDPDELAKIPYLHHERWDGSGYPLGLRGTEIPYHVRLFSVIDVWEAMSVDRPYRGAIPQAAILGYIARSSGTLFDPEVVDAFLRWRKKTSGDSWAKLVYPAERELGKEERLYCEEKSHFVSRQRCYSWLVGEVVFALFGSFQMMRNIPTQIHILVSGNACAGCL